MTLQEIVQKSKSPLRQFYCVEEDGVEYTILIMDTPKMVVLHIYRINKEFARWAKFGGTSIEVVSTMEEPGYALAIHDSRNIKTGFVAVPQDGWEIKT